MDVPVVRVFDAMAEGYDELEPWYDHLYRVLHGILRAELTPAAGGRRRALDVGCGTGYQTALLAELGYAPHGVDLASALLRVAHTRLPDATFVRADAMRLPYGDETFDAVTCCGSTLSLVSAPVDAIREMGRVLRPGGQLLLECEHRWSLDLGWAVVSALTGDSLRYGIRLREALHALIPRRGFLTIPYPLPVSAGETAIVPLRLFRPRELRRWLVDAGLHPGGIRGIHILTNLIPSTVLHRPRLSRWTAAVYQRLAQLDDRLRGAGLSRHLANSLVVTAVKTPPGPRSR